MYYINICLPVLEKSAVNSFLLLFWVMNGHYDLHSLATFLFFHELCHKDKLSSPLMAFLAQALVLARRVPAKALPLLLSAAYNCAAISTPLDPI